MRGLKNVYVHCFLDGRDVDPRSGAGFVEMLDNKCRELGVNVVLSEVWAKGGEGGRELAEEVVKLCEEENSFNYSYPLDASIKEKIETIAKNIYGADGVDYLPEAEESIAKLTVLGFDKCPVCVAKTQNSLSDNASLKGAPKGFRVTIRNAKISSGAGCIVVYAGNILTMPGLPPVPAAEKIDVDELGVISGLF